MSDVCAMFYQPFFCYFTFIEEGKFQMTNVDLKKSVTALAVAGALMTMAGSASAAVNLNVNFNVDGENISAPADNTITGNRIKITGKLNDKGYAENVSGTLMEVTEKGVLNIGSEGSVIDASALTPKGPYTLLRAESGVINVTGKQVALNSSKIVFVDGPTKALEASAADGVINVNAGKLYSYGDIVATKGTVDINATSAELRGDITANGGNVDIDVQGGLYIDAFHSISSELTLTDKAVVGIKAGEHSLVAFDKATINGSTLNVDLGNNKTSTLSFGEAVTAENSTVNLKNLTLNTSSLTLNGGSLSMTNVVFGEAPDVGPAMFAAGQKINLTNASLALNNTDVHGGINVAGGDAEGQRPSVTVTGGKVTGGLTTDKADVELGNGAEVDNLTVEDANVSLGDSQVDEFRGNGTSSLTVTSSKAGIGDNQSTDLKVRVTGNVTDDIGGAQGADELLKKLGYTSEEQKKAADITMEKGDIVGETTIKGNTVTEAVNTDNLAVAEMVGATPAVVARIQANELRKRLGDVRANENANGVWARYNGGAFSGEHELDADFNMIQIGFDKQFEAGQPRLGMAVSYAQTDADNMAASTDADTVTVAAYAAWMADEGLFADVIGRFGMVSTDITMDGKTADMMSATYGLSGEVGYRFNLADQFFFEPSVELTFNHIEGDSFVVNDIKRTLDDTDSLMARVGVASGMNLPNNLGNVYVRLAGVHEFMGESDITTAGLGQSRTITFGEDETWFEYAVGGTINFNPNTYMYVDLERTEGADIEEDWRANVGVRYSF